MSREQSDGVRPLSPGTVIERYTVLSVLGQGACGIAYLVRDEDLGRRLMLKEHAPAGLCRRSLATGEIQPAPDCELKYIHSLSDFLQEATVLSKLRLPAVPEVYEVFEAGGTACLVLSYVEGQALHLWLGEQPTRRSLLPLVLAEALRALGRLHRLGVRHRDIKPGHIILDAAGAVNFIDFGAAFAAGEEDSGALVPAFTPPYSPPEQGVPELEGAASDLYALAASFYEVTLGEKPPTAAARLEGAELAPLAREKRLCAEFPAAYLASVDKALSLEPQKRFAVAEQWLAALSPPAEAPRARRRLSRGALALRACCALAFAGWLGLLRGDSSCSPLPADSPCFEEFVITYDLPDGVFHSFPAWQGKCVQIDLVDADNLTSENQSGFVARFWNEQKLKNWSPDNLTIVLTDKDLKQITRSARHRYDAATRTLSFDFEPSALRSSPADAIMMSQVTPFSTPPEGWRLYLRMPMENIGPKGALPAESELRARQAILHIVRPLLAAPKVTP